MSSSSPTIKSSKSAYHHFRIHFPDGCLHMHSCSVNVSSFFPFWLCSTQAGFYCVYPAMIWSSSKRYVDFAVRRLQRHKFRMILLIIHYYISIVAVYILLIGYAHIPNFHIKLFNCHQRLGTFLLMCE